jgi:hypothetical protein
MHGALEKAEVDPDDGAPQVDRGLRGVGAERLVEQHQRLGEGNRQLVIHQQCTHRPGQGEGRLERQCAFRRLECPGEQLVGVDTRIRLLPVDDDGAGGREHFPATREFRVQRHDFFGQPHRLVQRRTSDEEFARLQVQLVRVQVFRVGTHHDHARRLVHAEGAAQRRDDSVGDLVLDGEDVVQLAVVGFRPQVAILHRVDQLGSDAHPVAGLAHAALEDVVDLQLARDHRRAQLPALVGERRSARRHADVVHLDQHVEQFLGDTVREVLVVRVRAHVDERQHRDRLRNRGQSCIFGRRWNAGSEPNFRRQPGL